MTLALVLFTRDLRLHDHPALSAACRGADRVVPLFVLDEAILSTRYASPNRVGHLVDALHDLRSRLRSRAGDLVVRQGIVVEEVRRLCVEVGADQLHLSADVSAFGRRREAALRRLGDELDVAVHTHPGVTVVPPGAITPVGGDHFQVFTPYWRRWVESDHRAPVSAPARVPTPDVADLGSIPAATDLVPGEPSPGLGPGGESVALARLDAWLDGPVADYARQRDDLAADGTSRISPHLHLGTLSAAEVVARLDRRRNGHDPFLRQLCWREFNHQLLAARPELPTTDLRPRGDRWHHDEQAVTAWKLGRTGYPIVDAGLRQLAKEGWMHNRTRMIAASFLTKHLYVDWRVGAWHFMDHLVDGDLANNFAQWQWVAGTGTDSRPNRMLNPVTQARRYDPAGTYVRRYVDELAGVEDSAVHAPWEDDGRAGAGDYPRPIVDHRAARAQFLAARGR